MESQQVLVGAAAPTPAVTSERTEKFSLFALTAMVVGSMVGAGIFSLPRAFATATGPFGAIIAWAIAAAGMYTLARVFQALAERKPDLDAGVYAYAKAGFGDYLGFLSAFGYFISACLGNTFYWVLIKSTLGAFFPIFGNGDTLAAVVVSSICIWVFHFTVLRGVQQAAAINKVVTVAKIVPIILFILILAVSFKGHLFAANFWGGDGMPEASLFEQVRATMLVTVFVFIGIEGASVYSRYAQKRSDVGVATIFGFVGVTCLMVLVTLLSYAVLPRAEIAGLRQPSMATVLEAVVGHWGAVFVSVGLIVSVLGAYLAWQMIAAEVLFNAAKTDDMPRIFATENENEVPATALWLSNGIVQLLVISTVFSEDAFTLMLKLASSMSLFPYLLVAGYALLISRRGETYDTRPQERNQDLIIAGVATLYTVFMIFAGGMKFVLLSAIFYAPGTLLYFWARREQQKQLFVPVEWAVFLVALVGAVIAVHGLATGYITI
jgi:arginine:ornithine antiporter / lysine permease